MNIDEYQAERLLNDINMILTTDEIGLEEFLVLLRNYIVVDENTSEKEV